jgi:hypothetical protein
MSSHLPEPDRAASLIPGAYEWKAPTSRQLGCMGGPASGSAMEPTTHGSMDAATIADREREGGGAPNQRRRTP